MTSSRRNQEQDEPKVNANLAKMQEHLRAAQAVPEDETFHLAAAQCYSRIYSADRMSFIVGNQITRVFNHWLEHGRQ